MQTGLILAGCWIFVSCAVAVILIAFLDGGDE